MANPCWTAAEPGGPASESILDEAQRLVGGARQADYGHPADDFAKTALLWSGILRPRLQPNQQVTAKDVALCMVGLKLSREVNSHRRDNLVDAAGYLLTAMMVEDRAADDEAAAERTLRRTHWSPVVYIAGRFRHPELTGKRRRAAERREVLDEARYAHEVMVRGLTPYSPLATSVAVCQAAEIDQHGDHWVDHDLRLLGQVRPAVLMRPGWTADFRHKVSKGAAAELATAMDLGLSVIEGYDHQAICGALDAYARRKDF